MSKIFIVILFISCIGSAKTKEKEAVKPDSKYLDFLKNYESSSDFLGDKTVTRYNKLNLIKETKGKEWLIIFGNKKVFSGDYDKYHYLMEVYNNTHLLVSCVVGKSFSQGPDTFERDSVVVLDLITGRLNRIGLQKIYLTRSSDFLFKAYNCPIDTVKYKEGYRYCAIDSIDMAKHQIVLINQCHQTEKFTIVGR